MSDFTVKAEDASPHSPTGSADDLASALRAAWELSQHTGGAVLIFDNRDGAPRAVARVGVEWLD